MLFPLAFILILSLFGQGDTGQLSGTVVDPNNAAIVNANVKLISQTTSQVRELATGDAGNFAFTLLQPGRYILEVSANGFRTTLVEDVHINITQTTTLQVHLDPAVVADTVTTATSSGPRVIQFAFKIGF